MVCGVCHSGGLLMFQWNRKWWAWVGVLRLFVFIKPEPLRWGTLYRCKACGSRWYLDDAKEWMCNIQNDRIPLIYEWNAHPISLAPALIAVLDAIGPTPPDIYGNGRQYKQTPCGVVTTSGERIDL